MAPAEVAPATDLFAAAAESVASKDYYSHGLRARFFVDAQRAPSLPLEAKEEPYADIGYDVNEEAFRRRSKARLEAGGLPKTVPVGWPSEVSGPLVWSKGDFDGEQAEASYVYYLTDADKAEIRDALKTFKGTYLLNSIERW